MVDSNKVNLQMYFDVVLTKLCILLDFTWMEMERLTRKLCTDSSTGTVYFLPPCVLATFLLAD